MPISSDFCVLMCRIDTEFDDNDLMTLFNKFHNKGVEYIYFVPAELISIKILLVELKVLFLSKLFNKKNILWLRKK